MNHVNIEDALQEWRRGKPRELPDAVRERVDAALASLPDRRRSGYVRRATAGGAAAAVACTLVLGSAFVLPDAAAALRQLPGLGSVFKLAGDYGLKVADEKGLVTAVNQSVTDNGITVEVNEVMYDGSRLSIGYVQSVNTGKLGELTRGLEFRINGKPFKDPMGATGSRIDEHTYAGALTLNPSKELPDRFELEMDVSQIGDTKGSWRFVLPVRKMASSNKAVMPMMTKTQGDITLTVQKLLFTPGSTELTVEVKQPASAEKFLQYDLIDDRGIVLERHSGGGGGHSDGKVSISTFKQSFGPVSRMPRSVTVRPFIDEPSYDAGKLKEQRVQLDQPPIPEHPLQLPQGPAGRLIVTEVERLPDKTLVHYRTEGLIPQDQANVLWIEDSRGVKHLLLQKRTETVDPDKYMFVREFPAFPAEERLTLVTRELAPPKYLQELEMTIPVQP